MGRTVEELQESMSSAEFSAWVKYADEEPFGFPWQRWQTGVTTSALVNAIHNTIPRPKGSRRPKSLKISDFYPEQKKHVPELTAEQKEHIRKKRMKKAIKRG